MLVAVDQAVTEDQPVVLDILDEAAQWLQARGIEQWPARFGGVEDWRSDRITKYITAGESWLLRIGDEPVGTFNLSTTADPDYADGWPEGPQDALYIFRMAVRRKWAGLDLGTRVLDWASARAKAKNLSWLRLDCHRRNRELQRYYERRGFIRVGTLVRTINDNGTPYTRGSGALYQRPAGSIHYPTAEGPAMTTDRYDPTGEAEIWQEASSLVASLKMKPEAAVDVAQWEQWNGALEQAARLLENESRAIRQRDGMYFRVITGQRGTVRQTKPDAGNTSV